MIVDTHAAHRAGSASGNSDFFTARSSPNYCASCTPFSFAPTVSNPTPLPKSAPSGMVWIPGAQSLVE
jgi:hypothetical protein